MGDLGKTFQIDIRGQGHTATVNPKDGLAAFDIWNGKGGVTLIDPDSFAVIGTAEFDQPVMPLRFDATGKSLLVLTGSQSKKSPVTLWCAR